MLQGSNQQSGFIMHQEISSGIILSQQLAWHEEERDADHQLSVTACKQIALSHTYTFMQEKTYTFLCADLQHLFAIRTVFLGSISITKRDEL